MQNSNKRQITAILLVFGYTRNLFGEIFSNKQSEEKLSTDIQYLCVDYYHTFIQLIHSNYNTHSIFNSNNGHYLLQSLEAILLSNLNNTKNVSFIGLTLLYHNGTTRYKSLAKFHKKCDGKGPTLTIITNNNGYIFGGYTSKSFGSGYSEYGYVEDKNAFLFTIYPHTKVYKINPNKSKFALYDTSNKGPWFGENDLIISGANNLSTSVGSSYLNMNGIELAGSTTWSIDAFQVYSIDIRSNNDLFIQRKQSALKCGVLYQSINIKDEKCIIVGGHSVGNTVHVHNANDYDECNTFELPIFNASNRNKEFLIYQESQNILNKYTDFLYTLDKKSGVLVELNLMSGNYKMYYDINASMGIWRCDAYKMVLIQNRIYLFINHDLGSITIFEWDINKKKCKKIDVFPRYMSGIQWLCYMKKQEKIFVFTNSAIYSCDASRSMIILSKCVDIRDLISSSTCLRAFNHLIFIFAKHGDIWCLDTLNNKCLKSDIHLRYDGKYYPFMGSENKHKTHVILMQHEKGLCYEMKLSLINIMPQEIKKCIFGETIVFRYCKDEIEIKYQYIIPTEIKQLITKFI